jgi:hypothetical protein
VPKASPITAKTTTICSSFLFCIFWNTCINHSKKTGCNIIWNAQVSPTTHDPDVQMDFWEQCLTLSHLVPIRPPPTLKDPFLLFDIFPFLLWVTMLPETSLPWDCLTRSGGGKTGLVPVSKSGCFCIFPMTVTHHSISHMQSAYRELCMVQTLTTTLKGKYCQLYFTHEKTESLRS